MLTHADTHIILTTLETLPPEQVAEVRDFALFLRERYGAETLTAAQREELERRLAAYDENPNAGMPWEEFHAQLRAEA